MPSTWHTPQNITGGVVDIFEVSEAGAVPFVGGFGRKGRGLGRPSAVSSENAGGGVSTTYRSWRCVFFCDGHHSFMAALCKLNEIKLI